MSAAIVHTLRIEAHTDAGRTVQYFTLDSADLRTLQPMIERALSKERALEHVARSGGLTLFDPSERGEPYA